MLRLKITPVNITQVRYLLTCKSPNHCLVGAFIMSMATRCSRFRTLIGSGHFGYLDWVYTEHCSTPGVHKCWSSGATQMNLTLVEVVHLGMWQDHLNAVWWLLIFGCDCFRFDLTTVGLLTTCPVVWPHVFVSPFWICWCVPRSSHSPWWLRCYHNCQKWWPKLS